VPVSSLKELKMKRFNSVENSETPTSEVDEQVVLTVEGVTVDFPISRTFFDVLQRRPVLRLRAVDHVGFKVYRNQTLGLVGESGGGKSTLGRAINQLDPLRSGRIRFLGNDLACQTKHALQQLRRYMQMVFQDPYSSLNPSMTVGQTIKEVLRFHGIVAKSEVDAKVEEILSVVGLSNDFMKRRPRALSGGERQRVGLARALALNPTLLILDEPVAALDVSIQAQVLNLLQDLREKFGLAMIFIAHELSVVRHVSERVAVMYLGRIVEQGTTQEIFEKPAHPYTLRLLDAIPRIRTGKRHREPALKGETPSPLNLPLGCRFHPRCPKSKQICKRVEPEVAQLSSTHQVSCHLS
jgi:oligopeptide transport system ATP-binding protein